MHWLFSSLLTNFANIFYLLRFLLKTCCSILEVYRKENALPCQKQNWSEGHGFSYFQKLYFFLVVNELCKSKCYF